MKTQLTISVLISFLLFQLIYSFMFPSVGTNDNWQPISTYLPKFSAESSDNLLLDKIYPLVSSGYRLNSDTGHYLELAQNFSPEYFNGNPFLERPLYSFLIFLISLPIRLFAIPSYGIIFGLAILINFILISIAVLLFFSLLKKVFSEKVAFLASILLIFSPFVHSFLNQPLAEMLMVFGVILSAYLLHNYIQKPGQKKLVCFYLIVGALMLGKMFFAISFFVLLLSLYFKRYREGLIFFLVHLIPLLLWYVFVTRVWGIAYYSHGVQHWHMGVWMLDMMRWPWQESYRVLLKTLPDFLTALIYGFLLIPVVFSAIGFTKLPFKSKKIFYFGSIAAVFLLGFLTRFYYIRHVFLIFPIIYPTAILGMESVSTRLKTIKRWLPAVFYAIVIALIIIISNVNIYRVFDYNR